MVDTFCIVNARVPRVQGLQQIWVQNQTIVQISPMSAPAHFPPTSHLPSFDVKGDWMSLGGIDLQINGALGLAFPDLRSGQEPHLDRICDFLWEQGIDGFLPTIVTTSLENIHQALATLAHYSPPPQPTAKILGVHLEGPFLNPEKRGAHPQEHLLPLTIETVKRVLGDYAAIVKLVTLAPELDPTGAAIGYLRSLGITVSLGHSLATAAQAQLAFRQGASMVTHAFNAMPGLHHREPGLLGAAIVDPQVACGLIADGQHVSPLMVDVLLRASGHDQGVFLVSDALAPLGLPDGTYPWDTRQITIVQGTAKLADGTLAGTTLPLWVGVKNLLDWGICDLETAIAMATISPRRAIGLPDSILGQPAHFLRWSSPANSDSEPRSWIWRRWDPADP